MARLFTWPIFPAYRAATPSHILAHHHPPSHPQYRPSSCSPETGYCSLKTTVRLHYKCCYGVRVRVSGRCVFFFILRRELQNRQVICWRYWVLFIRLSGMCLMSVCLVSVCRVLCWAVTEETTADEDRRIEAQSSFVSNQVVVVKPQAEADKKVEVRMCLLFCPTTLTLLHHQYLLVLVANCASVSLVALVLGVASVTCACTKQQQQSSR